MKFHPEHPFDSNKGENVVWSALRTALHKEKGDAFYRVPLIGRDGFIRYEPDIILFPEDGLSLILECKGFRIEQIDSIRGAMWQMSEEWFRRQERPVSQARDQAFAMREQFESQGIEGVKVRPMVALPFVLREEWMASHHAATGLQSTILFAEDLEPGPLLSFWQNHRKEHSLQRALVRSAVHCLAPSDGAKEVEEKKALPPSPVPAPQTTTPGRSQRPVHPPLPTLRVDPGLHFLRYQGVPPNAQELRDCIGLDDSSSYTYLVATAAIERARRAEGLGGQHQLRKDLRPEASDTEHMELLFHKALRHFIRRPVLTRGEERLVLQRAIREVVEHNSPLERHQLLRDVFAWREVLADLEQQGIDLSRASQNEAAQWAHPSLLATAVNLQGAFRKERRKAGRGRTSFEDLAIQYVEGPFRPTPVIVMEGFTRLTPLQERFVQRCLQRKCRVWIVQPHRAEQATGFAAVERTWTELAANGSHAHALETPLLSTHPALQHLQATLFAHSASAQQFPGDDSVRITAFSHRNDEISAVVTEVVRLIKETSPPLRAQDLAVVCTDPIAMAPLLREESELLGHPDLFAVPPRQLLLTPVGRFALTLYEIWPDGRLHLNADQFTTLLAAGWLGGQTQRSFEQFEAVAAQQFTHCRSEQEWRKAFSRIRTLRQRDGQLSNLARRLPASCVDDVLLQGWESAFDTVVELCRRLLRPGERSLGEHIKHLLDEVEQLDEHRVLQAERAVLVQIRDALADLVGATTVDMGGEEFGQILGSLIHQREDSDSSELHGANVHQHPQRVWVVGPEGVDNVTRERVYFIGLDDAHLPAPGLPPWPRGQWSVGSHVERQRYRFLAVTRAARGSLCMSYAQQDWERDLRPSPYLEQAAMLLNRSTDLQTVRSNAIQATVIRPETSTRGSPRIQRDTYTLEELALFQLCPHRFKLEALSDWGQCYGNAWQLGWLARGVWLAEVIQHLAERNLPPNAQSFLEAQQAVKPGVHDRLAGLPKLSWLTIERDVRRSLLHLAQPWNEQGQLQSVQQEHGPGPVKEVRPSAQRTVRIQAQVSYRQGRGQQSLVPLPEVDLVGTWLIFGKRADEYDDQADQRLWQCVTWWRSMVFKVDSSKALDAARNNELLEKVLGIEQSSYPKKSGHHCNYCPVQSTCMGVDP